MASVVTFEQVEGLAAQLPPQEQLKLLARISERLTKAVSLPVPLESKKELARLRKERMRKAESVLRECDRAAAAFPDKTDSVETIRRMREERHRQ